LAKLVGVFNTSHSPFCYSDPGTWAAIRASRPPYDESVPVDDREANIAKGERVLRAQQILRAKLAEVGPDVIIVFGDDQHEMYDFDNHPAISVYLGVSFSGRSLGPDGVRQRTDPAPMARVPGHPALATRILTGLLERGFDPGFMMGVPKPDAGMSHAVMRPISALTNLSIPVVPLLCNGYHPPQLTAGRSYLVGRAIAGIIEEYPGDLRVAVMGSGGLWHTPGQPHSRLDESFDRRGLEFMARGDVQSWAVHFDGYHRDPADPSQQYLAPQFSQLPRSGGPQGGTRETCNWIGAAAVADRRPHTVVDYVPVYASPIGLAFAYTTEF
jgi:Catalytic LigB subunit of aromatic ring-opening dioxygenase